MNRIFLDQSEVTFDDEIAESFYYDSKRRIIEIGFGGCFHKGEYRASTCILRIATWKCGKSKLHESQKFQDLEANLGVVSLLLSFEVVGKSLMMLVNTVDNRYVEWHFESAGLEVILALNDVHLTPDSPPQASRC